MMDAGKPASRKAALIDLFIVVAVLVGVKQSLLPFTTLYAGPVSTGLAMIVATYLLWRRKSGWQVLGFRWPERWFRTFGYTALCFLAYVGTIVIFRPIAELLFENVGTSGRFAHVEGNLSAYLVMLVLVWSHSAFFEELLFRAFIISKTSLALGQGRKKEIIAVIVAATFFGYRHYYYQGFFGALITGGVGLVFGFLYLWLRNTTILPLIFAHGIINTIGQTARFIGGEELD